MIYDTDGTKKIVTLKGPSGCGKSFSLIALLWHYLIHDRTKYHPVVITPTLLSKEWCVQESFPGKLV